MTTDGDALASRLDTFRGVLLVLAEGRMDRRLRAKVDPADLVQQALARAFERREQFHGTDDAQRFAWLRKLLANTIVDAARQHGLVEGRGRSAEASLEAALEASSARLERLLPSEDSTPSHKAARQEQFLRLANAVAALPEDQRRAVEMRYLQNLPVADIATHMDRSVSSIAGLLQRGLRTLRQSLAEKG